MKLHLYNEKKDADKHKPSAEMIKFYNSRYNKDDLSSYIVVTKKPRKSKIKKDD
jgi:hypothetical protein